MVGLGTDYMGHENAMLPGVEAPRLFVPHVNVPTTMYQCVAIPTILRQRLQGVVVLGAKVPRTIIRRRMPRGTRSRNTPNHPARDRKQVDW